MATREAMVSQEVGTEVLAVILVAGDILVAIQEQEEELAHKAALAQAEEAVVTWELLKARWDSQGVDTEMPAGDILVAEPILLVIQEEEVVVEVEVAPAHLAHHKPLSALNNSQLMVGSQELVLAIQEEAHSQAKLFKALRDKYLLDPRRDR
jgi:hypothetical protein